MEQTSFEAGAKARWGGTEAYKDYESRAAVLGEDAMQAAGEGLMKVLSGFGTLKNTPADGHEAQAQTQALRDYISAHFYDCTVEVFSGLGRLYAEGGDFTEAIDRACGEGTAAYAAEAIRIYCEARL